MIQLAQVVHDLKTPMSCVKLTINLVRMMIEDSNPEVTQLIKNINVSFEFIFQMIEDIQDLAKFSNNQTFTFNNELFKVGQLRDEIVTIFEEQCVQKKLSLKFEVEESVPIEVYADLKRFKQLLINLISNAFKFTTKGGISISMKCE